MATTATNAGNAAGEIKGGPAFVVTVGEADRLCLDRNKHLTTDRYNGLVFCAGVPNHTLVTRRNGTTLISSNCWMYSTTGANMMRRLSSNMPFVRLNPHSGASIVKNGKDEGGWCGLSLQFQRENGIAEEGTGPLQWPVHEYGRQANQRFNDPAFKAAMAKYRITDDFYDLGKPAYRCSRTPSTAPACSTTTRARRTSTGGHTLSVRSGMCGSRPAGGGCSSSTRGPAGAAAGWPC